MIGSEPINAQSGGSVRAYEVLGRSHSVRPDSPTCGFISLPNMDSYYFNRHLGAALRLLPVLRCGTRWLIKPASLGH